MTELPHEHWLLRVFDRLASAHAVTAWIMTAALLVAAVAHFGFDVGNYPHSGARMMVGFVLLIMASVTAGLALAAPRLRSAARTRLAQMIGVAARR